MLHSTACLITAGFCNKHLICTVFVVWSFKTGIVMFQQSKKSSYPYCRRFFKHKHCIFPTTNSECSVTCHNSSIIKLAYIWPKLSCTFPVLKQKFDEQDDADTQVTSQRQLLQFKQRLISGIKHPSLLLFGISFACLCGDVKCIL